MTRLVDARVAGWRVICGYPESCGYRLGELMSAVTDDGQPVAVLMLRLGMFPGGWRGAPGDPDDWTMTNRGTPPLPAHSARHGRPVPKVRRGAESRIPLSGFSEGCDFIPRLPARVRCPEHGGVGVGWNVLDAAVLGVYPVTATLQLHWSREEVPVLPAGLRSAVNWAREPLYPSTTHAPSSPR
jgi:hypothetical protein